MATLALFLKTLCRRAGLWVLAMHVAVWLVIVFGSVVTGSGSSNLVHLPRAYFLEDSWIEYGAVTGGLFLLLSAVFVWSVRSNFRTVWRLTPERDRRLFWGELKFNAIGVAMLLTASLASVSAHHWIVSDLGSLPEVKFVRVVFSEPKVEVSPRTVLAWTWILHSKDIGVGDSSADEKPAPDRDLTTTMKQKVGEVNRKVGQWWRSVKRPIWSSMVFHAVLPFHLAFMTLLYVALCRGLTIRHRVMAG